MTKQLSTVYFWFCVVLGWLDVSAALVLLTFPTFNDAAKIFLFSGLAFFVGALANNSWLKRQS